MAKRTPRETWEALGRPPWWTWPLLLVPFGGVALYMSTAILFGGLVLLATGNYLVGAAVTVLGLICVAASILERLYNNDVP